MSFFETTWHALGTIGTSTSPEDLRTMFTAMLTALAIGIPILWLLLKNCLPEVDNKPELSYFMRHREKNIPLGPDRPLGTIETDERLREVVMKERQAAFEKQISDVRSEIPLAAAEVLVQRGQRLIGEKKYEQGLVVFLAMLYHSVDSNGADKANAVLPSHLPDCLRGAAQCYRNLNMVEHAVKFLQAERLIYEEMVSTLLSKEEKAAQGTAIVASLFQNGVPSAGATHRYDVLSGVADQCMKRGYPKVALAYRVKAAAMKRRSTGESLDTNSNDMTALAEALRACEPVHDESNTTSEGAAKPSKP